MPISSDVVKNAIKKLMSGKDLSRKESRTVMTEILEENATEAQVSAYLVALRMKGETVDEITGAAQAFSDKSDNFKLKYDNVVDTCGTGGDNLSTFNISTTAAIVTAGAGVTVAKHGHKSISSKCGSSDLLEALGVQTNLSKGIIDRCFSEIGIAFLFSEKFSKTQPYLLGPRREIGAWTIFNLIGPLTNPARTKRQLIGVNDKSIMRTVVEVMRELGAEHIMAVHGAEGLDEISICGSTSVVELNNGQIQEYTIHPGDYGLLPVPVSRIQSKSCEENVEIMKDVLNGKSGPARDVVLLNAAAAIRISGKVDNLNQGLDLARESIDSGAAKNTLQTLIDISNSQGH